jgi:hypothetical protein
MIKHYLNQAYPRQSTGVHRQVWILRAQQSDQIFGRKFQNPWTYNHHDRLERLIVNLDSTEKQFF